MEDREVKHLEFIQAVITRQAGNSFLIKGWTLTIATAILGVAAHEKSSDLAFLAIVPVVAFGVLDAYYLRQERLFRCLYNGVLDDAGTVPPFSMDTTPFKADLYASWPCVLRSRPLWPLYGAVVVVALVLAVVLVGQSPEGDRHSCRTRSATSSVTSSGQGSVGGQMSPIRSSCHRGTR